MSEITVFYMLVLNSIASVMVGFVIGFWYLARQLHLGKLNTNT